FGLLPILAGVVLGAGWIGSRLGRQTEPRDTDKAPGPGRIALLLLLLAIAASLTPSGPGSWLTQVSIARFFTGDAPIALPIQEMLSPYAASDRSIALWSFRIALPVLLIGAILARRAIGWPLLAALLLAALLGGTARRAMSIFGCTALVAAPLIVDAGLAWIRSRTRRAPTALLLIAALVCGIVGVVGLINGRIFLAQDKNLRVGSFGPPNYGVRAAAAYVRDQQVEGPLFHAPVHAGPLLLENGSRLTPFLDARWLGSPEKIDLFLRLRAADDRTVPVLWTEACQTYRFEAVLL